MEERNLGHARAAIFFKVRAGKNIFYFSTAKGKLDNNNNNNKNLDVYKSNFTQQFSCEDIAIFSAFTSPWAGD